MDVLQLSGDRSCYYFIGVFSLSVELRGEPMPDLDDPGRMYLVEAAREDGADRQGPKAVWGSQRTSARQVLADQ